MEHNDSTDGGDVTDTFEKAETAYAGILRNLRDLMGEPPPRDPEALKRWRHARRAEVWIGAAFAAQDLAEAVEAKAGEGGTR